MRLNAIAHRAVIAPAQLIADGGQRQFVLLAQQIHGNLACVRHVLGALASGQVFEAQAEMLGNDADYPVGRTGHSLRSQILQHRTGEVSRQLCSR